MKKPKTDTIHIQCTPEFKKLVKEAAVRRGKTIKETVIVLLNSWLKIKEEK